jgi:hypothetical protein
MASGGYRLPGGGRGAVVADPVQRDGDVRPQDQVAVDTSEPDSTMTGMAASAGSDLT